MDLLENMMERIFNLVLLCSKKCSAMSFRKGLDILLVIKVVLYMFFSHNYARIKSGIYNSLTLEKTLTLHNTIILIKSVFKKNQNHYYSNIFLEKCSYQEAQK